jgi:hypothetical protein
MTITTRAGKGAALTHTELDTNFTDLRDGVALAVPKTAGSGLKVDSLGTPTFGWQDLLGTFFVPDITALTAPNYATFRGGIKQWQFAVNDEASVLFHLPHDYVPGSDIHVHVHWSHGSSLVTGGTLTWGFELSYAKGHNQAAFAAPITVVEIQAASTTAFQHMICEAPASIAGGSANLLNTSLLEVDGILTGRLYLATNALTVSSGPVPDIFAHTVDIHYQSTGVATKNRAPNFYG